MLEDIFFSKSLELLKKTDQSNVKVAVLNFLINMAWKDGEKEPDSKARKHLIDIHLKDMLIKMKEVEKDSEVRLFYDRLIKKLN